MKAFAIRLYRKRWLQITRKPDQDDPNNGWRALTWTDDMANAEKWADRETAEAFLATLPGPGEVIEMQRPAAPTPVGGRIRLQIANAA